MSDQTLNKTDVRSKEALEMNRRCFLKGTGAAVAGISLPLGIAGCDTRNNGTTTRNTLSPPAAPTGVANVGVVRGGDVEEMVRAAVAMAGGLSEIRSGDTVVIKPNITSYDEPSNPRITTTPEVLRAVIRMVKERTAARNITVAEATAFGMSTERWATQNGQLAVIQNEGVNFLAWETGNYTSVRIPSAQYLTSSFRIPTTLFSGSFDHFINVPILKNHEMVANSNAEYTCCIKLQVGTLHPNDRTAIHTRNLGNIVAELNLAVPKTTMNIVDALTVVLTEGPGCGETASPGLIIASPDRVAADSVAVAVLRCYAKKQNINKDYVNKSVWSQAQIQQAQKLNLGRKKANIVVLNEGVNNINEILAQWA